MPTMIKKPQQRPRCGTCYDERVATKRNDVWACRECSRCSAFQWESAREEVIRIEQSAKWSKP